MDEDAISLAINTVRRFLTHPKVTPRQVISLGRALYALERMPEPTSGAMCEFGVTYRAGDRDFNEKKYIDFRIDESTFAISVGGSVYDRTVGSDSYSEPGWNIEIGCYHDNSECSISTLEYLIEDYLGLGAKITASDECDDDFEMYGE